MDKKAYNKQYNKTHREKIRKLQRDWYRKNKKRLKARRENRKMEGLQGLSQEVKGKLPAVFRKVLAEQEVEDRDAIVNQVWERQRQALEAVMVCRAHSYMKTNRKVYPEFYEALRERFSDEQIIDKYNKIKEDSGIREIIYFHDGLDNFYIWDKIKGEICK